MKQVILESSLENNNLRKELLPVKIANSHSRSEGSDD